MPKGQRIQFKKWDCELVRRQYQNGRVALELVAWQNVPEQDIFEGEPVATCTVNLPQYPLAKDEVLIKDYSENEGMLQTLLDAGVVELAGRTVKTGFVVLPVCILK